MFRFHVANESAIAEQSRQAEEKKVEELTAKLEQAIAARQEIEAELTLARKTITEFSTSSSAPGLETVRMRTFP